MEEDRCGRPSGDQIPLSLHAALGLHVLVPPGLVGPMGSMGSTGSQSTRSLQSVLLVQDTQVSEEPQPMFVQARPCCSITGTARKYRGERVVAGHCAPCKICILAFS